MTRAVSIAQGGSNNVTMRNRIINGGMMIDQRNAGASINNNTSGTQFSVDRWNIFGQQASKFSAQQTTTVPTGFRNSLLLTSLSAYAPLSGDRFIFRYKIEGYDMADLNWGTANAQTATFSFWVRSSLTGTFGGTLMNDTQGRCFPFTYTINSANTWEQKTVTVVGDTTGTWETGSLTGLQIWFSLGAGSTYTAPSSGSWIAGNYTAPPGAQNFVSTNAATLYITGVQLEAGTTATPFEQRLYGTELALCQRYYEKSYNIEQVPGGSNIGAGVFEGGITSYSTGAVYVPSIAYQVAKRTAATLSFWSYGGSANTWNYERSGATGAATPNSTSSGTRSFSLYFAVGAAWVPVYVYGHWAASAEL